MTALLIVVVAVMAPLTGCKTPEQMKAEYPDWPHWGWWENPASASTDADGQTQQASGPSIEPPTAGPATAARPDDSTRYDSPAEASVEASFTKADPLADHRSEVWKTVSLLRDLDARGDEQRAGLLAVARREMPTWYRPMPVDAPDPTEPDWVKVLIWDFMPEKDFKRAVAGWRAIATREEADFPYPATRRRVMTFVENMLDAQAAAADAAEAEAAARDADGTVTVQVDEPADDTQPTPVELPPAETETDTPDE
ncbi:MAG: hypothetical protein GVY16_02695 [Planctomycetes bacterium]|nr:hypothetical protein [Phycisphaerae bacterium]NBB94627.1 hypothetical protein [Planctomycetota bacterium]